MRWALATFAVLAAIACSAGAASATVLCKEAPNGKGECPKGKMYEVGQNFKFAAGHNQFTGSGMFCEASETQIELLSTGGAAETVKARVLNWTFSTCSVNEFPCQVTTKNLPYFAEFHWTAGGNGTLTEKSEVNGDPVVNFVCGFGYCLFETPLTLSFIGENPASLRAEKAVLKLKEKGGFLSCPEVDPWDATLVAKTPTGAWLAKE